MEDWRVENEKVDDIERYKNVIRENSFRIHDFRACTLPDLQGPGHGNERELQACWWESSMEYKISISTVKLGSWTDCHNNFEFAQIKSSQDDRRISKQETMN